MRFMYSTSEKSKHKLVGSDMTNLFIILMTHFFVSKVTSEFRFCHNGPHRIKDTDCPGGFIAKNPINLTCAHYAISDAVPEGSTPQVVESYCDAPSTIDLAIAGGEVQIKSLQEFTINILDAAAAPSVPGNFTPEGVCMDKCLEQWVDPNAEVEEDHMEDYIPSENGTVAEEELALTKELFISLLTDETFDEDDPEGVVQPYDPLWNANATEPRIVQLLAKSMQIMWGACNPFVEDSFLRQVLKAMIILRDRHHKAYVDIGIQEFKVLSGILTECQDMGNTKFRMKGSNCGTFHRVEAIEDIKRDRTWRYRPTKESFIWGKYDPIPEVAWASVRFVHGYCSPLFLNNFPHFHIYVIAMEALFPEYPVQRHWTTPTNVSLTIWNSVLETADIKIAMRNVDACSMAGLIGSIFKRRIERPFVTEVLLSEPKYTTPQKSSVGWPKSLAAYWNQYDARGGFKSISQEWGYCLQDVQDPEAKQSTVDDIKSKTCTTSANNDESPH